MGVTITKPPPHPPSQATDTPLSDSEVLCLKLKQEIRHLKSWLESQQMSKNPNSKGNLIKTIESLIKTRQRLLDNIERAAGSNSKPKPYH